MLLFYVSGAASGGGAGRLYWSERSRRSISQNRCLALDKITDIYLGAQTTVLKRATELAVSAATDASSSSVAPNESLLFSLLSDTTMLDLEATTMPQLCYWLWGLGVIMNMHDRSVNEREAAAGDETINCTLLRGLRAENDDSMEMSDGEVESLKREMMSAEDKQAMRRRHTRKFSVAHSGMTLNESLHLEEAATIALLRHCKTATNPVAPLQHSFGQLRTAVSAELTSMSNFVTHSFGQLLTRARTVTNANASVEEALATEQRKRRRLQNKLIELQGNIRVFARVRPLSESEKVEGSCVEFTGENTIALTAGSEAKQFEFDRVYAPQATQADVFRDVAPFVQSAVDGYNICVFAYGQTGAGQ